MSVRLVPWIVGLLILAVSGIFIGAAGLSPQEVWHGLTGQDEAATGLVRNIRLPRVAGGLVVGAGLGVAGIGLQGVFRNTMGDPYLFGVSSAGGLGLAIGVSAGLSIGSPVAIGTAVAAAVTVVLLLRRISSAVTDGNSFVLAGLGVTLALLAWTLILIFLVDSPRLPTFTYFVFGGLGTADWSRVLTALALLTVGFVGLRFRSRELDLLSLGDREAASLGVEVEKVRLVVLVAVALATAASVVVAGVVGFVALLATPIGLKVAGPVSRRLMVASAVVGAVIVLAADLFIRALPIPVEIPLGVVTGALGGPVLIWLITRTRAVAR